MTSVDKMTNVKINHAFAGIVIIAQSFNPSIFSETWLSKNFVVEPEHLMGTRFFAPEAARFQIDDKDTIVEITPERLQILFKILGASANFDTQLNIPIQIVEALPHTPYQSMGINFDYFIELSNGQDFLKYNRSLLGTGEYKLLNEFAVPDARFGRYFSKDYRNARLKLSIIPVTKPGKGSENSLDLVQFSFNYHFEVSSIDVEERSKKLCEYMRDWSSLKSYSEALVDLGANL